MAAPRLMTAAWGRGLAVAALAMGSVALTLGGFHVREVEDDGFVAAKEHAMVVPGTGSPYDVPLAWFPPLRDPAERRRDASGDPAVGTYRGEREGVTVELVIRADGTYGLSMDDDLYFEHGSWVALGSRIVFDPMIWQGQGLGSPSDLSANWWPGLVRLRFNERHWVLQER